MKNFAPHLFLSGRGRRYDLSIVLAVAPGFYFKSISPPASVYIDPKDQTKGRKHVIEVQFERTKVVAATLMETVVKLTRADEVFVEVRTIVGRPDSGGASSAHYGDPRKKKR